MIIHFELSLRLKEIKMKSMKFINPKTLRNLRCEASPLISVGDYAIGERFYAIEKNQGVDKEYLPTNPLVYRNYFIVKVVKNKKAGSHNPALKKNRGTIRGVNPRSKQIYHGRLLEKNQGVFNAQRIAN